MARLLCCFIFGLYWLHSSRADLVLNITCRYRGVFHVEKDHRYSLTRDEGVELCQLLNSSLATMKQLERAYAIGFETCRYGWIEENIVVPRIHPHPICAANNTGIYVLTSNITDRYDVYCFNASETKKKVCDPVILPPSLTLYQEDKTDQKEQEPQPLGPGSGTETPYQEKATPSKSDSQIDHDEKDDDDPSHKQMTQDPDYVEPGIDTTTAGYSQTKADSFIPGGFDYFNEATTEPSSPVATGDEDNLIQIKQHPISTSVPDTSETPDAEDKNIVVPPQKETHPDETHPDKTHPEETQTDETHPDETHPEQTQTDETHPDETHPEQTQTDETHPDETHPEQTQTDETHPDETHPEQTQTDVTQTDETHPDEAHPDETQTDEAYPDKTHPDEAHPDETHPDETQTDEAHPDGTQTGTDTETDDSNSQHNKGDRSGGLSGSQETTDAPGLRKARVPDWLIVTVSLISLALILAVCIAVNSRRRCGHKKKLVINGSKGPVEDGRMEEVNGEASRSQEMVHLVHQEHTSDTSGRLMSAEQIRNQQQVDMKIGV
uniref:CD44 antigen n=1 Tax=Geotrypetes seraphini TaxID=260995 RepID=A0A6P8QBE2_GEOSA|nr:CD44 antigen isoform X2 [Geotrypetes seraphini]